MSCRNLRRLGNQISVPLPKDFEGFLERECPQPGCLKVFKVKPRFDHPEPTDYVCPYCGQKAKSDQFFTKTQIEYGKEKAHEAVTKVIHADFTEALRPLRSSGMISVKTRYAPTRSVSFRHTHLPTTLTCTACHSEYKVAAQTGHCPDCGQVNGETNE